MYPKLKAEFNQNEILKRVLDESCNFLTEVSVRKVAPKLCSPGKDSLPLNGVGTIEAINIFNEKYKDSIIATNGSRYFGYVVGGATPAAIAGDWLTSVFDQCATGIPEEVDWYVEKAAIDLLKSLLNLPDTLAGVCVSGATMANFVGLSIARQWVGKQLGFNISEEGLHKVPEIKVASANAHASVNKTLAMLGLGRNALTVIPTLENREAIDVKELETFLQKQNGDPVIVVANAGTVNTTDFDDLSSIIQLREKYNCWVHVDAAFAGIALCSDKYSALMTDIESADSITIDAHKWLNVPYDSAFLLTRHPNLQSEVFYNGAAYLETGSTVTPTFNMVPENSRRFRALPVWMTLMAYGKYGYQEIVERNCALAKQLSKQIDASPVFKLLAPTNLNIICFTIQLDSTETKEDITNFLDLIREEGTCFLTPTFYNGNYGMRIAISNWKTEELDIKKTWKALNYVYEKFIQDLYHS